MKTEICPSCFGPCISSWSGLDLVENSGDETLAYKNYEFKPVGLLLKKIIKSKISMCKDNSRENRARKGAYVDCLVIIDEILKLKE